MATRWMSTPQLVVHAFATSTASCDLCCGLLWPWPLTRRI